MKKENNKLQIQQETQASDSGHSMVEMLGTLAVMGVLAIGGIVGYKYAMTEYRSNEIANELNLRAASISTLIGSKGPLAAGEMYEMEMGDHMTAGMGVEAVSNGDKSFSIYVDNVPEDLTNSLMRKANRSIAVALVEPEENVEGATSPTISFEFANSIDGESNTDDMNDDVTQEDNKCTSDDNCSGDTPRCNKTTGECEACPAGTKWALHPYCYTGYACRDDTVCISDNRGSVATGYYKEGSAEYNTCAESATCYNCSGVYMTEASTPCYYSGTPTNSTENSEPEIVEPGFGLGLPDLGIHAPSIVPPGDIDQNGCSRIPTPFPACAPW